MYTRIQFQLYDPALVFVDRKFSFKAGLFSSTFYVNANIPPKCCITCLFVFKNLSNFLLFLGRFFLLYGRKTKSTKWHPKECSNKKVEENKLALKSNFLSKHTKAKSYSWNWTSQRALVYICMFYMSLIHSWQEKLQSSWVVIRFWSHHLDFWQKSNASVSNILGCLLHIFIFPSLVPL